VIGLPSNLDALALLTRLAGVYIVEDNPGYTLATTYGDSTSAGQRTYSTATPTGSEPGEKSAPRASKLVTDYF